MKKRIAAIIASVFMLMAMVPAMAFAEDVQPAVEPQMVGVTIGLGLGEGNGVWCTVTYEDGKEVELTPETGELDVACEVGKKLCEALNIATMEDPKIDGDSSAFLGWTVYEPGAGANGEPREIDIEITTQELMEYVIPNHNLMIVAQWDQDAIDNANGDGDEDWAGPVIFAVSGNGGRLVIKDEIGGANKTVDCYDGEFLGQDTVANAVPFKIVSAEKSGSVLSGWTVYEADRIEIDSIEASVAKENGGLPPWGDPELKHFLFDEYVESGVAMNTFIGLWNHKLIDTSMSTEDLYNLGGNDKSYYAVANWATGTVKEMTVNGQPARLEIADDIVAVDAKLKAKFKNVEQLKNALLQEAYNSNENFIENSMKIKYMDIVLKIKNKDGIWEVATPENFPEEGIEIVIPYPEGINKDSFQFSVLHMFTHGNKAGTIETLEPELKDDGLHVVVHSLSPFAVAYQEMDDSPAMGDQMNMLPWVIMAAISAAAGALMLRRRFN